MYLVKLKDSQKAVARKRTENAAREAMAKRQRTCPAAMFIEEERKS